MGKIIGLSCGRKNEMSETFLKEAAMGAEELGVETEIIRAMTLKVLPCKGCLACGQTGKCGLKDDVEWILRKTCVEDAALIVAVPCYHIRTNAVFASIHERMNHVFMNNMDIMKKTRVGGIIGIGGSGYDGWTSLNLPMVEIFMQHTRKVVDKIQINFCALREWNLWARTDMTPVTQKYRVTDLPYEDMWTVWGPQESQITFFKKALARARQLGRHVAKAMATPIEDLQYVGEKSGVACPVCQSNILHVHEDLPYVSCPVCAVRGEIVMEDGKMKVQWNDDDAKLPRFSHDADLHHLEWLQKHYMSNPQYWVELNELKKKHRAYGKIIKPDEQGSIQGGKSMTEKKPSAADVIMQAYKESNGEYVDLVVEHGELPGIKVEHLIWWGEHMNDPGLYKLWHPQDHVSHRADTITGKDGKAATVLCAEERIGDYAASTLRMRHEDHKACPVQRKYGPMATMTSLGPNDEVVGGVYHECQPTQTGMLMRSTFRLPVRTPKEFLDALYKHAKEEMENFPKFLPELYTKSTGKVS